MDRSKCRKLIKDVRWSGWVWVSECFFWYRPTRVVPHQRPLNGCVCMCVCVCYFLWPRTLNSTGTISVIVSHDRILQKKSYIKSIIHDKMAWLRKTKLSKLSACVFTGSDEERFSEFLLKQYKAWALLLLIIIILIIKISTRVLSVYGSRNNNHLTASFPGQPG